MKNVLLSLLAWMPTADAAGAYLEVHLDTVMTIGSWTIKGRKDHDQWVTKYRIEYSRDGDNWFQYMQPFGEVKVGINEVLC